MFSFISWESFLTITAAAIIGYYLITALTFYRAEILHWIKSPSQSKIKNTLVAPTNIETMMGATRVTQQEQAPRSTSIAAEELVAMGAQEEPELVQAAESNDNLLIGSVADLLEEIKTLIQIIAEYRKGKTESEALFNALFIRYPHLQHTTYPLAVSFYISDAAREHFSFDLSADEVIAWWGLPTDSAKQNHLPTSL